MNGPERRRTSRASSVDRRRAFMFRSGTMRAHRSQLPLERIRARHVRRGKLGSESAATSSGARREGQRCSHDFRRTAKENERPASGVVRRDSWNGAWPRSSVRRRRVHKRSASKRERRECRRCPREDRRPRDRGRVTHGAGLAWPRSSGPSVRTTLCSFVTSVPWQRRRVARRDRAGTKERSHRTYGAPMGTRLEATGCLLVRGRGARQARRTWPTLVGTTNRTGRTCLVAVVTRLAGGRCCVVRAGASLVATVTSLDRRGWSLTATMTWLDRRESSLVAVMTSRDRRGTRRERTSTSLDRQGPRFARTATSLDRKGSRFGRTATSLDRKGSTLGRMRTSLDRKRPRLGRTRTSVVRRRPRLGRTRTSLDRRRPRLGRTRTSLDRKRPRLVRTRTSLHRKRPRLVRTRTSLNRKRPRLARTLSCLDRKRPRLVRTLTCPDRDRSTLVRARMRLDPGGAWVVPVGRVARSVAISVRGNGDTPRLEGSVARDHRTVARSEPDDGWDDRDAARALDDVGRRDAMLVQERGAVAPRLSRRDDWVRGDPHDAPAAV